MRFPIGENSLFMLELAREALDAFLDTNDLDQLTVARRAMLRASRSAVLPEYWVERFGKDLQELELIHLSKGYSLTACVNCYETLNAMELEVAD